MHITHRCNSLLKLRVKTAFQTSYCSTYAERCPVVSTVCLRPQQALSHPCPDLYKHLIPHGTSYCSTGSPQCPTPTRDGQRTFHKEKRNITRGYLKAALNLHTNGNSIARKSYSQSHAEEIAALVQKADVGRTIPATFPLWRYNWWKKYYSQLHLSEIFQECLTIIQLLFEYETEWYILKSFSVI